MTRMLRFTALIKVNLLVIYIHYKAVLCIIKLSKVNFSCFITVHEDNKEYKYTTIDYLPVKQDMNGSYS